MCCKRIELLLSEPQSDVLTIKRTTQRNVRDLNPNSVDSHDMAVFKTTAVPIEPTFQKYKIYAIMNLLQRSV